MKKSKKSKVTSKFIALLVASLTLSVLTSCETTGSSQNAIILNVFQPSTIRLPAGSTVSVIGENPVTGKDEPQNYTPQTNEVWHSDKRFRDLERRVISSGK